LERIAETLWERHWIAKTGQMITLRLMKPQVPKLRALLKAAAESDIDMRILHDDLVYSSPRKSKRKTAAIANARNIPQ
jgi:hypothetical protein